MTVSTLVEPQLDTINRQAKRLAKRLKLPVTQAKNILASALYRCSGWQDLEGRVRAMKPDEHVRHLVALPHSSEAQVYFNEQKIALTHALSQLVLTNSNLIGLMEHIKYVFAIKTKVVNSNELLHTLDLSWRPAGIGPDPWAVIEADARVNGTCLKLIGTRTYLPEHYDFGPNKHKEGKFAEPFGGRLKIVWSDPTAWFKAALEYLDDPEADDLVLPAVDLSEDMSRHEAWFEAALYTIGHIAEYQSDNDLVPLFFEGSAYVVFGAPVLQVDAAHMDKTLTVNFSSKEDSFSQVVASGENALCLEWISYDPGMKNHDGEFVEYFDELRQSILHGDDLPTTARDDGKLGLLFVRPATIFKIKQAFKVDFTREDDEEALVLKTSNLTLALELISKVSLRDLMVYKKGEISRYFAILKVPDASERPELSISLESKGDEWDWNSNLTPSNTWSCSSQGTELRVEVDSQLLNLVDLLGKRTVEAVMSHGLIHRLPLGSLSALKKQPERCKNIPAVSEDIAADLNKPFPKDVHLSLYRIRYLRDNF
jgi:hypothetical protein